MKTIQQGEGLADTLVASNIVRGQHHAGSSTFQRANPANRRDIVTVAPVSSRQDVVDACQGAREALRGWARVPAPQRAQVLARFARLLSDQKEALARFAAREMGKPLREARGSVQEAIDTAMFFQSEGRRLYGQTVPSELPDKELCTYRRPIGVTAVITAGNFPVAVPCWKIVPGASVRQRRRVEAERRRARECGLLAELWQAAGLPDGVLSVVHGVGAGGAGELLAGAGGCGRGGQGLVHWIHGGGAKNRRGLRKKSAGSLLGAGWQEPTRDPRGRRPRAGRGRCALGVFRHRGPALHQRWQHHRGQARAAARCGSGSFSEPSASRIGDPMRRGRRLRAVHQRALPQKLDRAADAGLEDGAELLLDGRRVTPGEEPPGFRRGCGERPVRHAAHLRPREDDDASGPGGVLRTHREPGRGGRPRRGHRRGQRDTVRAVRARSTRAMLRPCFVSRRRSRAGMTSMNNSTTGAEAHMPFGGNGWSGNGTREGGIWVLDSYTRWQAVNVDLAGKLQKRANRRGHRARHRRAGLV